MNSEFLTCNIEDNIKNLSSRLPANFNFIKRELLLRGDLICYVLYLDGLVKQEYIENSIISPLLYKIDCNIKKINNPADYLAKKYITSNSVEITKDINILASQIKRGKCAIIIENNDMALICNTTGGNYRTVTSSQIEKNIKGGREAFVENLETNISLIQSKLKNSNLKMEKYVLGEQNQMDAVLIYVENIIDNEIVENIKSELNTIKMPYISDTGYINQLIEKFPYGFFPQYLSTEKPDKVIAHVLQGKAAFIIDGSPAVLIMPAVFQEFFHGLEDYSNRLIIANFDRLLRMLAMLLILTLTPAYYVLVEYNAELIPLEFTKIIVDSRLGIPLPPLIEIIVMELLVDLLREGGLRLPTPVGQTLSTVGGIVLGDAAIRAGLVSPTTLVVVTVTAICTFVIPNYEMVLSLRLLRYFMLILASLLGFFGILIGLYLILIMLILTHSFGIPYLAPYAPLRNRDLKDSLIRFHIKYLKKTPVSFRPTNRKELKDE